MHTHRSIDYLKIDIEGDEWSVLEHWTRETQDLRSVRQLSLEVHLPDSGRTERYENLIRRVENLGFVRFFSRPNRWTNNAFEIAWFNKNFSLGRDSLEVLVHRKYNDLVFNKRFPSIV